MGMENEALDDLDQPVDEALLRGEEEEVTDDQQDEEVSEQEDAEQQAEQKPVEEDMPVVPRARFNEVNEERKALKAQLEQLQGQQQIEHQEQAIDMKALRREATTALLDGDMDKHDEIQDRIQSEILRQAEAQAEARMAQRIEYENFQSRAAALVAEFPVLDSEKGDPDAISMVVELRDAYINKGMGMTQALESAARRVAPLFGGKAQAEAGKPDDRTLKAVKRGVESNESIPPQGAGVGNRAQPLKSDGNVSQAEWERMSPTERERMLNAA